MEDKETDTSSASLKYEFSNKTCVIWKVKTSTCDQVDSLSMRIARKGVADLSDQDELTSLGDVDKKNKCEQIPVSN